MERKATTELSSDEKFVQHARRVAWLINHTKPGHNYVTGAALEGFDDELLYNEEDEDE